MQISSVALVCTQKTGAPISRSRSVPPPTPVTTAKKMNVTSVCLLLGREQGARNGEHGDPEIVEQDERLRECGGFHRRRFSRVAFVDANALRFAAERRKA